MGSEMCIRDSSKHQYGGRKGVGTEHFLIDTWESVMVALEEEGSAANLVSIDFEKAFNRVDHNECIKALLAHGASETSVNWTAAFLHGRRMSVRLRKTLSQPRPVPGGSPQGSILGNFLFCITTDQFSRLAEEINEEDFATMDENGIEVELSEEEEDGGSQASPVRAGFIGQERSQRGIHSEEEDEECEDFVFFRRRRNAILSSSSSEEPALDLPSNAVIHEHLGIDIALSLIHI